MTTMRRDVPREILAGGGVRPLDVERRLQERPPRRYRRALAAAVSMVRDGVQSVLEELYAVQVEQAHGPPGDGASGARDGAFGARARKSSPGQ
ncbi:MAG: hypothetical protein L0I76_03630 [Pseudonocardia sp.]|nr:hypothetical protein [Pseudonocardia sp.]